MLYLHLFLYGLLVKLHRIHMLQVKNTVPSSLTMERYLYFLIQFCPFTSNSALQFQIYPFFSSILHRCIFSIAISARYSTLQPSSRCPRYEVSGVAMQIWICGSPSMISPARLPLQSVLPRYKSRWSDPPRSSGSCDIAPYPTFQS